MWKYAKILDNWGCKWDKYIYIGVQIEKVLSCENTKLGKYTEIQNCKIIKVQRVKIACLYFSTEKKTKEENNCIFTHYLTDPV